MRNMLIVLVGSIAGMSLILALHAIAATAVDSGTEAHADGRAVLAAESASLQEIPWSSLTGGWHDPDRSGAGWVFMSAPNGLFGYYFGNSSAQAPLWLVTEEVRSDIRLEEEAVFTLLEGEQGSFTMPVDPSEFEQWGELRITFHSCTRATAEMDGQDGMITLPLSRIHDTAGLSDQCGLDVVSGKEIFRYETFGSEAFWTGELKMHEVLDGVSPLAALQLGLKVDAEALPAAVAEAVVAGQVDLEDPAVTKVLLQHDAVVGVRAQISESDGGQHIDQVAITCALCHSTVDDSVLDGVGKRLDGWANLDLDPGAIIALSEQLPDELREQYRSWGPGMYDPRFNIDGISDPVVIPPAYGLMDATQATYTGDGDVSYWNAYVAVSQMGGQGTFIEPPLGIEIINDPDLVTSKLRPLEAYQLAIAAPAAPLDAFDSRAVAQGRKVFEGKANCVQCHSGPALGGDGRLYPPEEVGQSPAYAERTVTGMYRATPLRGLWLDRPFFHDGSAHDLNAVVDHYDNHFALQLTEDEKSNLVEYLKTL